jgi:hypothetical protein
MAERSCTVKPQPVTGRRHVCSAQHLLMCLDYRAAREADEARRDETVGPYGYGSREWLEYSGPMITFREYLIQLRRNT